MDLLVLTVPLATLEVLSEDMISKKLNCYSRSDCSHKSQIHIQPFVSSSLVTHTVLDIFVCHSFVMCRYVA